MSYIRIDIGGKERGLKFNNYALEQMLLKIGNSSQMESVYATVYGGLKGNSYAKEEVTDYTFENVIDWVDELLISEDGEKKIADVMTTMTETNLYKATIEKYAKSLNVSAGTKKKTVKKKV